MTQMLGMPWLLALPKPKSQEISRYPRFGGGEELGMGEHRARGVREVALVVLGTFVCVRNR